MSRILLSSVALLLLSLVGGMAADSGEIIRDIEYARVGEQSLKLDLHLPHGKPREPLIVWVHGGAWRSGSKSSVPIGKLAEEGYAIASVDYRLSTVARFPAPLMAERRSTTRNA